MDENGIEKKSPKQKIKLNLHIIYIEGMWIVQL